MTKKEARNHWDFSNRLMEAGGFTQDEIDTLLRCERTLTRWAERECGDSNANGSWCIVRDEDTNKTFEEWRSHASNEVHRYAIPDRETGALKRVKAIVDKHPGWAFYHQSDPRGCALYLLRPGDVPDGADVSCCYTNGIALCY